MKETNSKFLEENDINHRYQTNHQEAESNTERSELSEEQELEESVSESKDSECMVVYISN